MPPTRAMTPDAVHRLLTLAADDLPCALVHLRQSAPESVQLVYVGPAVDGLLGVSADELMANAEHLWCNIDEPEIDRLKAWARERAALAWAAGDTPVKHEVDFETRLGDTIKSLSFKCTSVREDGEMLWFGQLGEVVARELHIQTVLESAPSALVVANAAGEVQFYNQRALDVFQVSADQLLADGESFCDAGPEHRPSMVEFGGADGNFLSMQIERKRGDGSLFWAHVTQSSGDFNGQMSTFSWTDDISERKQAAEFLNAAKLAAEEAASTKSAFLVNMSHEIRTPMNAIIGLAHLALRTDLSVQQRDYLAKIHGAGKSLLGIINDILDFSKIEANKLEVENVAFNLDEVLTNVSTLTSGKASDKGLELLFEIPADVPRALISDPLRLGQVLTNLISNAVKFTENGQILVRCRPEYLAPVVDGGLEPTPLYLHFSVIDSGIGMTAEQCAKIFKPFSQAEESTTRRFGGTGLGLSICKRLVEMVDGSIGVRSQAGEGSEFYFSWKCAKAPYDALAEKMLPEGLEGMRVLVVDDNPVARDILSHALREFGFEVDMAGGGAEGLASVQMHDADTPFRLVFTDWNMPGIDGLHLTDKIKADDGIQHKPSVVLVTAFSMDEVRERAEHSLIDGFVSKPVNRSSIFDTLVNLFSNDVQDKAKDFPHGEKLPHMGGMRVLLVEDNEINQQIAVELLRAVGIEVDVACNGQIGVDKAFAQGPDGYHVVLMDLQMPVMDGHEAAQTIRRRSEFNAMPIVAMTAHALVEERARCLADGMNDHITKPIDPSVLYQTLWKWGAHGVKPQAVGTQPEAQALSPAGSIDPNAAQMEQLAQVPGLNHLAGLRRVAGNQKLYLNLLRRYCEDQAPTMAQVRECLARGEQKSAEIMVHTLKGVSANIGADAVAVQAGLLEAAISRDDSPEHIDALLLACSDAFDKLAQPLAACLGTNDAEASGSADPAAPLVPMAAAQRDALNRLVSMLEEMDADASEAWAALQPQLKGSVSADQLKRITMVIADFDFDQAGELLRQC